MDITKLIKDLNNDDVKFIEADKDFKKNVCNLLSNCYYENIDNLVFYVNKEEHIERYEQHLEHMEQNRQALVRDLEHYKEGRHGQDLQHTEQDLEHYKNYQSCASPDWMVGVKVIGLDNINKNTLILYNSKTEKAVVVRKQ